MNDFDQQHSPRVRRKRRQVRSEVLAAARDILFEQGGDAVTLASVAGRLGMTKQALYHYFAAKEALARSLVTVLVDEEIGALLAAVNDTPADEDVLAAMMRAFYSHYRGNLHAFRFVYCRTQVKSAEETIIDADVVRDDIAPRTGRLFDMLEARLSGHTDRTDMRARARTLAYTAWSSVLGLVTIIGISDAISDPLLHSDEDLLDRLVQVFHKGQAT